MVTWIWVTWYCKPLPEPMLTCHPLVQTISQEIPQPSVTKMSLKLLLWNFIPNLPGASKLTHWGRVMHICLSKIFIIGSDNSLLPGQCQVIIWTNAGILLIGPLGINFSEILIKINTLHSRKCIWKCHLQNGVYFVFLSSRHYCGWLE